MICKYLETWTAQQVFDKVVKHLRKQNAISYFSKTGGCAYRGDDGFMCAAGCLIPDDEYDSNIENINWSALVRRKVVPQKHEVLIVALQGVHDNAHVTCWDTELGKVAAQHQLDYVSCCATE